MKYQGTCLRNSGGMKTAEMSHEQLYKHHHKKLAEWNEEKEWFQNKLAERNDSKQMKQIRFLLVENHQLQDELQQAREREEVWITTVSTLKAGYNSRKRAGH